MKTLNEFKIISNGHSFKVKRMYVSIFGRTKWKIMRDIESGYENYFHNKKEALEYIDKIKNNEAINKCFWKEV